MLLAGMYTQYTEVYLEGGAPAERQIKTLVFQVDGVTVLVLLRGDHPLSEQKLLDAIEAKEIRPAGNEEIRAALGASAGSLGASSYTPVSSSQRTGISSISGYLGQIS